MKEKPPHLSSPIQVGGIEKQDDLCTMLPEVLPVISIRKLKHFMSGEPKVVRLQLLSVKRLLYGYR